jgi:F-type H+-transporting ATPase subunit delta
MIQAAINYGQVLYERSISEEVIEETALAFHTEPELKRVLCSPVIKKKSKYRIIEQIFSTDIRNFLKVLVDRRDMDLVEDIFQAWRTYTCMQEGILEASLYYVEKPQEEQIQNIKQMLCEKYDKKAVRLRLIEDPGLIGGFILRVGDVETDWSLKGRLRLLEQKIMRR